MSSTHAHDCYKINTKFDG